MHPHNKLFIPGPVEVSEKTWAAFSRPMIGHRGEDFKNLYRAIHPGLQTMFGTKQPVFLSTSSAWGVMDPLPEICCTLAKYPDVTLVLDTVSSFSGVKIDMDALGIDVMLTGAQKALALPPGFSLFSVSGKAFSRAERIPNRGFY